MTQTQNRPAGNGAASEQVNQTEASIPPGWHKQAEWEGQWWYAQGYADGYAAAERAIAQEITRAIGVEPYSAKAVIRGLIADIGVARKETAA